MAVDDPILPAAAHLTGPFAGDVLRPAVEQAGGDLRSYRCTNLHYRPGSDLVARFRAKVSWHGAEPIRETLVAATTASGPPRGTVPVVAATPDGELTVGVWRWPFDPGLPALESAVRSPGDLLAPIGLAEPHTRVAVKVMAYRPTERAVLRLRANDRTWYLKLVRPKAAGMILDRQRVLHRHTLPVPEVLAADAEQGWMLLSELAGPTLRDLIKADAAIWIEPEHIRDLVRRLAAVDTSTLPAMRSRIADAPFHTRVLEAVLPEERDRLVRLRDLFETEAPVARARPRAFVHGDLHESQLVVNDGRVSGLLDVDEAGAGDPIDDVGVLLGHLRYRASTAANGERVEGFVDALATAFAVDHHPHDIAIGTAAVLTGIATTPFRLQRDGWQEAVSRGLGLVERCLAGARPPV